jgi:hypothetical protein
MTNASSPTAIQPVEKMITDFAKDTINAAQLLHSNHLMGQMMVIIYSAIDTMGLLDAPPGEEEATGVTFKAWVTTYLLPEDLSFEFNDVDLWGARCAVLHTFTAESRLSKGGHARQLQYFGGDKDTSLAQAFPATVRLMDGGGKHVAVNYDDMLLAFLKAIGRFAPVLEKNCKQNGSYESRLRSVLQQYHIPG